LKFSAATLTYGNRLEFLYPVLNRLVEQDFDNIYVYCNGVTPAIYEQLQNKYQQDNIVFLYSSTNLGSAGGYYGLLQHIMAVDTSEYLLLLDDDNLVPETCFDLLQTLEIKDDELYYFHRPDRALPKKAKEMGQPELVIGTDNAFLGRDFFTCDSNSSSNYCGDLLAAPYGGLLLSKKALDTAELPKKELYLYADDYEYTNRLVTVYGFIIKFSELFLIEDLEKSYHLKKGSTLLSNRYSNANKLQLYYSVRNNTWLGLRRSKSKVKFLLNMSVCSAIFLVQFLLTLKLTNIRVYIKAVFDGFIFYKKDSDSN